MRTPLPVLAAALAVMAAGVATLYITIPNRPASVFINASALQPGQNITLHLDYVPMNVTVVASANARTTAVCMYYHGVLIDGAGNTYPNMFDAYFAPFGGVATSIFTFRYAEYFQDTNVTILVIAGEQNYGYCPRG